MEKLWNHMSRSAYTAEKSSFQKLKENIIISKTKDNTIKNMVILL